MPDKTTNALITAALLVLMVPWGTSSAAMVSFDIADTDVVVGELFDIQVVVNGVDPFDEVLAFGFDLDYAADWSLSGVQIGPDFDYDDSALFPGTDVAGSIDFLNFGPSGNGIVLATLSFTSSVAGLFNFGIITDLFDPNEGLFTFAGTFDLTASTNLTIRDSQIVLPAPATLGLFAFGMVPLLGWRWSSARRLKRRSKPS